MLTPDHFKRSTRAFATTARDFDTVLGRVPTDRAAATALLQSPLVADSLLFEREHGLGELLPYVARLFPGVPVLPVAVRIGATRAQWEAMVELLKPWVTPRTLVIQSTDFSHYLSVAQARRRDQQMLNVIAAGDLDAMARARQPDHIDSRGSQYIQMRLQALLFGAQPIVFGNYNSADRGATGDDNTTSYVAQVYAPAARDRVVHPALPARTLCVAGDSFFGRHVAVALRDEAVRQRVADELRRRLNGCPLLINLEGVLSDDGRAAHDMQLAMPADDTLRWLRELGVVAVSVANNHSRDLGDAAYAAMVARLREAGLQVLEDGQPQRVGALRVTAWTDLDNNPKPRRDLLRLPLLLPTEVPDLAFMHWGREFVTTPGQRERALGRQLASGRRADDRRRASAPRQPAHRAAGRAGYGAGVQPGQLRLRPARAARVGRAAADQPVRAGHARAAADPGARCVRAGAFKVGARVSSSVTFGAGQWRLLQALGHSGLPARPRGLPAGDDFRRQTQADHLFGIV